MSIWDNMKSSFPFLNVKDYKKIINRLYNNVFIDEISDSTKTFTEIELFKAIDEFDRVGGSNTNLFNIYRTIEFNPHLASVKNRLKQELKGRERCYSLFNSIEKINIDWSRFFSGDLLDKYIDLWIEAKLWGYSAFVVDYDKKTGKFIGIKKEIPKKHIDIWHNGIRQNENDDDIKYSFDKLDNIYLINNGNGIYRNVARSVMIINDVLFNWQTILKKYGKGKLILKWDKFGKDPAVMEFIKDWEKKDVLVMDRGDDVDFKMMELSDSKAFKEFIDYCEDNISKVVLNNILGLKEGGSLAQGTIQDRNTDKIIGGMIKELETNINIQLIPFLRKWNINIPKGEFYFSKEPMSLEQFTNFYIATSQNGLDVINPIDIEKYTGIAIDRRTWEEYIMLKGKDKSNVTGIGNGEKEKEGRKNGTINKPTK